MNNSTTGYRRIPGIYLIVSMVFLILAVGLQTLVWVYWSKVLEPRLYREATSQASVLAHSQAVKLADVLVTVDKEHRRQALHETVDEILLFTDPESKTPLFKGLDLKVDYDVLEAPVGSLDLVHGLTDCPNCFVAEVGLYSPASDELIGIARFRVSDTLYRRLSRDVEQTLFTQSRLGMLLLLLVWGVVIYLIRALNRSRHQTEMANRDLQDEIQDRRRIAEELRASEHQLQLITDNSPAYIAYVSNDDLCYRFVNRRFLEAYELPKEAFVGRHVREIIGEGNYRFALPYIEKVRAGEEASYENIFKNREGNRWIQVNYVPDFDAAGAVRGIVVMSLDITERKTAQLALQVAKDAAETANRAKSAFLANMSHELRSPLNAILGFSELMRRDRTLTAEQHANLATIGRSGEYLLALINDVLEFSKIEAGRHELQPEIFNLCQLLLGLEEMFRLRAGQKGLELAVRIDAEVPQVISADQNKLRQVLINLLGNAVKFTDRGKVILAAAVSSPPAERGDERPWLSFSVTDTGEGVPMEEQERIFEAFVQVGDQQRTQQGSGLGLPISRKFVELMGGSLGINSEPGSGTRFEFAIPVEVADRIDTAPCTPEQVVAIAPNQPNFRLLVVDDHEASRALLVELLTMVGFEVREAVNGRQAVELCEAWSPDLVWMDIRMPEMDGLEATRRIKAASGSQTVVIALTASAFEEDRAMVMECGCDDFVRKPFREKEIFAMLREHLGAEFIYQAVAEQTAGSDASARPGSETRPGDMARLSADVIAELRGAIELSDLERMEHLVAEIGRDRASLAAGLKNLDDTFQYDRLLRLLDETEEARKREP